MDIFRLVGKIAIESDAAIKDIQDTVGEAEMAEDKMSKAFKKIGTAVAAAFTVDKITDFGKACVNAAVSISAETASFAQIMGNYSDKAQAKIDEIATTTGIVSGRLTGYMTSMTAKFQGLGYDIDNATTLAQDGLMIAADAAAFWDKSMEDSMSSLNSFINGNYEGGEAIGLFANETTLAAWSAENLGFKWDALTEKEKQFARLEFAKAMQETSGVTGQAANESEAYANVMGNLQRIWQEFQVTIGEPILNNFVLPAMLKLQATLPAIGSHVQNLVNWFNKHEKGIKNVTTALGLALTAMLAFKAGAKIQGIVNAFQKARVSLALYTATMKGATIAQGVMNGTLTMTEAIVALLTGKLTLAEFATILYAKAQATLNAVMSANPIGLVILAITALVAGFILLWKKSDKFREFWINLWANIKDTALKAKEKLVSMFTSVVDFFKNNWKELLLLIVNPFAGAFALLYKNNDEFRAKINQLRNNIANTWSSIKNALTSPIESAYTKIKSMMNKIKSIFPLKVGKIFSNLKIPKITVNGGKAPFGIGGQGKKPSFDIKWNAKGAIFSEPTIFATAQGFQGVGEAGAEAVAPIDTLQQYVATAVASQNAELVSVLNGILTAIKQMDSGMYKNIETALDNRKIQWNDRELGRLVTKYAR